MSHAHSVINTSLTPIHSVNDAVYVHEIQTTSVSRAVHTQMMFFIDSVAIIPANGSSIPPHPSTFIDEYGIGLGAISDQDCLEGARS